VYVYIQQDLFNEKYSHLRKINNDFVLLYRGTYEKNANLFILLKESIISCIATCARKLGLYHRMRNIYWKYLLRKSS